LSSFVLGIVLARTHDEAYGADFRAGVGYRGRSHLLWLAVVLLGYGLYVSRPDGTRLAKVRCHWLPAFPDGRYHYYLSFDPPVAFRPIPSDTTLKPSASSVKDDRVIYDWATTHYMGYLQGFDELSDRAPRSIEWIGERVVVRSQDGVVGEYELQQ
jgi:hypothetical protein